MLRRKHESGIFWTAALSRFCVFLFFLAMGGGHLGSYSRDTYDFHREAIEIAEEYAVGDFNWSAWIDDAWPQFVGVFYFFFGYSFIPVMLFNAAIAGMATVFLYRIALAASGDSSVAAACGYSFALFPSAIWFYSFPIKECLAAFAILSCIGGLLETCLYRRPTGWMWILLSLVIMVGLRIYMVPVLGLCVAACLAPIQLPKNITGMFIPFLCTVVLGVGFLYTLSRIGVDMSEHEALQYFDIDRINRTRVSLSRGKGRMFSKEGQEAAWGRDPINDSVLAAKAMWYTLVGINPSDLRSQRQIMAIPEAIVVLYSLPCLFVGIARMWQNNVRAAVPIILITLAIVAVYGAGTTNMGAMYRWRLQAVPGLILLVYYGAACRQKSLFYSLICVFRGRSTVQPGKPSAPAAA